MSETYNKGVAYCNVKNGQYAVKGESGYGTPTDFPYLKSVPLTAQVTAEDIFADGKRLVVIYSDMGYTGSIGTTGQDRAFEAAIGQAIEAETGVNMTTQINGSKVMAFYFETDEYTKNNVKYVVKNWLLNVQVGRPDRAHNTNTTTPAIGEYAYPAVISGETVLKATGTDAYVDDNGNESLCFIISALPNATDYDTFGDTVPTPKVPANF